MSPVLLLVKLTLILGVAWLAGAVFRRRSAAARHLIGVAGLTGALLLPFAGGLLPSLSLQLPAPMVGWLQPASSPGLLPESDDRRDSTAADSRSTGAPLADPSEQAGPPRSRPADASLWAAWSRDAPVGAAAAAPTDSGPAIGRATKYEPTDSTAVRPAAAGGARGRSARVEADRDPADPDAAPIEDSAATETEGGNGALEPEVDGWIALAALLIGDLGGAPPFGWLTAFWAIGAALVLTRLAMGWAHWNRVAIEATPLECPRIWNLLDGAAERLEVDAPSCTLLSDRIRVPMLWGVSRPTLMLPRTALRWSDERLRVVLLHELAHLRRRDGLSLLIGRLGLAACWFHPLAWMVEGRARRDAEQACDDLVLAAGERASTYVTHLIALTRNPTRPPRVPALSMLGGGPMKRRLSSILVGNQARGLRPASAASWLVGAALLVVPLCALEPVAAGDTVHGDDRWVAQRAVQQHPDVSAQPATRSGRRQLEAADVIAAHDSKSRRDWPGRDRGEEAWDRGWEAHKAENWEASIEGFSEAAERGFRVAASTYNVACAHARLGHTTEAIEWIERSLDEGIGLSEYLMEDSDLDPIRADPAFRRFVERMRDDDRVGRMPRTDRLTEVRSRYEDLVDYGVDEDENAAAVWYRAGSELLAVREMDAAIDALERAVDAGESHQDSALYNLACAHAINGDTRAALDHLERAVEQGFDSEERFENDSDLNSLRDEPRFGRIRDLHDRLSMDGYGQGSSWGIHGSRYGERRWRSAVEDFGRLVEDEPEVGRAWANYGLALHYSRRHEEAREAFRRQLDLNFRAGNASYNIACTYAMQDRVGPALDWLERAVEKKTFSAHTLLNDDDLELLRGEPRYEALVDRLIEENGEYDGAFGRVMRRLMKRIGNADTDPGIH